MCDRPTDRSMDGRTDGQIGVWSPTNIGLYDFTTLKNCSFVFASLYLRRSDLLCCLIRNIMLDKRFLEQYFQSVLGNSTRQYVDQSVRRSKAWGSEVPFLEDIWTTERTISGPYTPCLPTKLLLYALIFADSSPYKLVLRMTKIRSLTFGRI